MLQGPDPLGGEERLAHLHPPPARLEVERTHRPRLLHLLVRVEVLEEHQQRSFFALESNAQAFRGETGAPHRELAMEMLNPDGSAPEPRQSGFERLANRGSEPLVDRARLDRAPSLPALAGGRRPRGTHVSLPAHCFRSLIALPSRRMSRASNDGRKTTGAPGNRRA